MGYVLLLIGLICLAMVPAAFVFNRNMEWILGLVICLPLGLYATREGIVRLTRVCVCFEDEWLRQVSRNVIKEIRWQRMSRIRAMVENDDESRFMFHFIGDDGQKIIIRQGMFSMDQLDEMVAIIKENATLHSTLRVDDSEGVLATWEGTMAAYRRLHGR